MVWDVTVKQLSWERMRNRRRVRRIRVLRLARDLEENQEEKILRCYGGLLGKNVLSTSSVVTTELVSHRYGEQAAEATNHGLDAAGHAIGTAWAAFKIRKAIDPKSSLKPMTLGKSAVKAAAEELKTELKAKKGK
ncbi:hypothetical protein HPP92_022748 [Vanilla planifolia]|uniref:Senescence domain-containing protein n=1 Tax=Vanilla planifolia TaxID=51239 RepID=A0A835PSK2_VANPL|nr:hypothetical protein HPP92_022748 [Vanilla planifolia]